MESEAYTQTSDFAFHICSAPLMKALDWSVETLVNEQ